MGWRPGSGAPPERILLIQLRRIGDAVLVTPALDALRTAWPAARIHLLTAWPIPDLFRGDPRIDVVHVRPDRGRLPRLARDLRAERFDLCVDFQSLPWTALLARSTGAFTVGFAKRYRARAYHRPVRLEDHRRSDYAADHKLDLLRALDLEPELVTPRLTGPAGTHPVWEQAGPAPRIALVPVSLRTPKRWGVDRFVETAARIHRMTGAFTAVVAGPGEESVVADVAAALAPADLVPHVCTSLDEFKAVLGAADLFLGNDNGPRHIALALGRPTLAWFGPQNPTHWTPPADPRHPVLWNPERARGRRIRNDLVVVPDHPETAAAAAVDLLERFPRPSGAPA